MVIKIKLFCEIPISGFENGFNSVVELKCIDYFISKPLMVIQKVFKFTVIVIG